MFKKFVTVGLVLVLALAISGLSVQAQADDWWATVAAPYAGVTVRGVSESTPPSRYIAEVLAPAFTEATGINVEFEVTSWDEMFNKEVQDMEQGIGTYDFIYIEQDFITGFLANDYMINLTALMAEKPELTYADLDLEDFTTYIDYFKDSEGNIYGLPMEAFIKVYMYRQDLFEDPEIMAAFEEQYGWELRPAVTHDEYRQIAEFFTAWGQEHDMELWGTTVTAGAHVAALAESMGESNWPAWGVYNWGLNLDEWRATTANGGAMDSDTAKEALQWYIDLLPFAPPEAPTSTWDEVAASFAGGRTAQAWIYGENLPWIQTDETRSNVVGKVGVAIPPTEPEVLEAAIAGEGYVDYYDGGAFGIPHSSRNVDATWLFMQWVSRKEFQPEFAAEAGRVIRFSTFEDPIVQARDAELSGYFTLMKDKGYMWAGQVPAPFYPTMLEVIRPFGLGAIAGEIPVNDALDQMAAAVDDLMIELGYTTP